MLRRLVRRDGAPCSRQGKHWILIDTDAAKVLRRVWLRNGVWPIVPAAKQERAFY